MEAEMENNFYIMDGRARFDVDRAVVVEVCESLREAKQAMREYYDGYDYVVLNGAMDEILYDPMFKNRK